MTKTALETATVFLETMGQPDFFQTLGSPAFDAWTSLMAENATIEFPFAGEGFPKKCDNRASWVQTLDAIFPMIGRLEWVALDIQEAKDPEIVFATGQSNAETAAGQPYQNRYCFVFRVRDGEIIEYQEYFDPLALQDAFM